jgi:hypothetical protein
MARFTVFRAPRLPGQRPPKLDEQAARLRLTASRRTLARARQELAQAERERDELLKEIRAAGLEAKLAAEIAR